MSATPDSTLANPDQRIADLERQLAECKAERDEALAQQTATTEVLQVINSSPGHLQPVFDAMLEKAMRLCQASFGLLRTFDGECFHLAAAKHVPAALEELWRGPTKPASGGAQERLVQGEPFVHLTDPRDDEGYRLGAATSRVLADVAGARTYLTVPLRQDGRLLGTFAIYRQEVRPFTYKQIALLQNFAAQAVIAMENARLITETREALEQQTATAEVLQVINASPGDLKPVFDALLDKAMQLCGAAFGILNTYDGVRFAVGALRGVPAEVEAILRSAQPSAHGVGARMLRGDGIVAIEDFATSPSYLVGAPRARALVDLGGVRSYVGVALRKDGRLLGTIGVYRQEIRPFTDKQIALLQNFAAQAVIAMENARFLTESREALEQQTATAEVPRRHQLLARRSRPGVRCDARKGAAPVRGGDRDLLELRWRTGLGGGEPRRAAGIR
jgi:GAF domain-containing protein